MHWCYLPDYDPQDSSRCSYELRGEEAHHALKVMRLREGDDCEIFNGRGSVARAHITQIQAQKSLWLDVVELYPSPLGQLNITLALSTPKGSNMELIVQKSVELGISRLIPLQSEHSVVRLKGAQAAKKQEKWQRTALEACKQCKAAHLPIVEPLAELESFLARRDLSEQRICCALLPHARPLRACLEPLRAAHQRDIMLLIGPEGDFSPREYRQIEESGFVPVSLGSLILRVETAVFMALAGIRYALDTGE